jgi:hypothetical protein
MASALDVLKEILRTGGISSSELDAFVPAEIPTNKTDPRTKKTCNLKEKPHTGEYYVPTRNNAQLQITFGPDFKVCGTPSLQMPKLLRPELMHGQFECRVGHW